MPTRSLSRKLDVLEMLEMKYAHAISVGSGGVYRSVNPLQLQPTQLQLAHNAFHYEGGLQAWPGHTAHGTAAATPIMGQAVHRRDDEVVKSYRWHSENMQIWDGTPTDDWSVVWEIYSDSHADVSVSGTAVTSAALTLWDTRDVATGCKVYPGDWFIMAADDTGNPADPWQTIATVNSDTSITLTGAYTGGTAGPAACKFRKKYHGGTDQYVAWAELNGFIYFTYPNVKNPLKVVSADSSVISQVVDTSQPTYVPAARGITSFADRIIAWGIIDASYGGATVSPRTIAWSSDTLNDWSGLGSGVREFAATPGRVQTCKRLDQNLLVYTEAAIWLGTQAATASPAIVFVPKITSPEKGLLAEGSVIEAGGNRHVYLGQDDFYATTAYRSDPIGESAIRDFFFRQVNRAQLARIRGELFDEYRSAIWLVALGTETLATHAVIYDYKQDVFFGPIDFGAQQLMVPGHFVAPNEDAPTINSLVGTINDQDWLLGSPNVGYNAMRSPVFGTQDGKTYLLDLDTFTFDGNPRGAKFQTGSHQLASEAMMMSVVIRIIITYEQTSNDATLTVTLSDDDFATALETQSVVLRTTKVGATSKAYVDFTVAAERLAVEVITGGLGANTKIYEIAAKVGDSDEEFL